MYGVITKIHKFYKIENVSERMICIFLDIFKLFSFLVCVVTPTFIMVRPNSPTSPEKNVSLLCLQLDKQKEKCDLRVYFT